MKRGEESRTTEVDLEVASIDVSLILVLGLDVLLENGLTENLVDDLGEEGLPCSASRPSCRWRSRL